jgi:deoxyribodipyrimidine photo-lyase
MNASDTAIFPISLPEIQQRIAKIDPAAYARTRNFLDGAVTWLSPYLTHGVINTKQIAEHVLKHASWETCEKLIFELAWREFFHHVWLHHGNDIFQNMESAQTEACEQLPAVLLNANTNIVVMNQVLQKLFDTGAMHNHARMWTASLACNFAKTDWKTGSAWLHYHLMDGDLASNTLSWQWVAATFSNKPYWFNQDNINKYSRQQQQGTWLDVDYENIAHATPPATWQTREAWQIDTMTWPKNIMQTLVFTQDVCLHHLWNLDPDWRSKPEQGVHVLLIEPDLLDRFPMSPKRLQWLWSLAQSILPGVELYVENFKDFQARCKGSIYYKAYPLVDHWQGQANARTWMFDVKAKSFRRFYSFWKHHKKTTFGA